MDGRRRVVEYEPDRTLRDTEQVPLLDEAAGVKGFLRREALLHAPDARYDPGSVGIGREIGFTRHFHRPKPMRTFRHFSGSPSTPRRGRSSSCRRTCTG